MALSAVFGKNKEAQAGYDGNRIAPIYLLEGLLPIVRVKQKKADRRTLFKKDFSKFAPRFPRKQKIKAMNKIIQDIQSEYTKSDLPDFNAGDTVTVHYRIREGNKERVQPFQGIVLQRKGTGTTQTFTVRKISEGIGVERIFPLHSPNIEKIVVNKRGKVRRARIFYLRGLQGKKSRIKEKRV
jgi:large subunit ribosomal protein L19